MSKSLCNFEPDGKGCRCKVCGTWVAAKDCARTFRNCGTPGTVTPPKKLGDWTEHQLARLGVTPESYSAAKEKFGLAPTCNCAERKRWLNAISDWWRAT